MLQKNDFIELEYSGRIKDGDIFDTNIKEDAKKIQLEIETRPLIICIGQNQILPAIDEFLLGKKEGKHTLELGPEKAFGLRDRSLIKTMPLKLFIEKQIMPQAGMVFQFDNMLGKVSAVSGGRVIVDFNNPLSNKTVIYEINIKRKIEDNKEKVNALQDFFFRHRFDFELRDKILELKVEKKFKQLIEFFKPKFKDILSLDLEVKETEEKTQVTASTEEKVSK